MRRAFNSSHVRARCNLAVEEFKRGKGRGKAGGKAARGSQGAGDELVEGGDLEEQTAAAAAAEVRAALLAGTAGAQLRSIICNCIRPLGHIDLHCVH